jgi:membrane protease YdiL (CAAX protease family)
MQKLIIYITDYWKEEIKWQHLVSVMTFLGFCIFGEYYFHRKQQWMYPHIQTIDYFFLYIVFYSIPVLFTLLSYCYFFKRKDILTNVPFWLTLLYVISTYSFRSYFYQHRLLVTSLNGGIYDRFLIKCANESTQALLIFSVVFVYWLVADKRINQTFYGFKIKGVDIKPYLIMLGGMVPLIGIASTQSDFLLTYPTFQSLIDNQIGHALLFGKISIYEILYGSDYVATELFFRGFMLVALGKYLGKGAILPMASMYVFIHFGKPLGETISSFFGGMILGIIAYETKSIIGGIIVHCGIAYLMELGGFIGNAVQHSAP